jgi:hypothetical protein
MGDRGSIPETFCNSVRNKRKLNFTSYVQRDNISWLKNTYMDTYRDILILHIERHGKVLITVRPTRG